MGQGSAILVMGPSGSGKSTLAAGLALELGASFLEGDDFHPTANRDAMTAGIPLTDEMRWPWLAELGAAVRMARSSGDVVFSCSALKRVYRQRLREAAGPFETVFLTCPREIIAARMAEREHFMPGDLLDSQIAALEPPEADEGALIFDVSGPHDETLRQLVGALRPGLAETRHTQRRAP